MKTLSAFCVSYTKMKKRHAFIMPLDPIKKKNIWKKQLVEVKKSQKDVFLEKIKVNQEMISLKLKELQGNEVLTEISACHKKELDARMGELVLIAQENSLLKAISSLN